MYRIFETREYQDWLDSLTLKEKAQVHARIARVKTEGHFGLIRRLDKNLAEFKWKNVWRIYFSLTRDEEGRIIILLLGGNKNTQFRDIKKAKSLISSLENKE